MADTTEVETLDLKKAKEGSYYFISGAGGDLAEWVKGYEDLLEQEGIGKPVKWFQTTGAAVNDFAFPGGWMTTMRQAFPHDLTCLAFPLDGLNAGKLAMFKMRAQDRWFDDVVDNMRRGGA